MCVCVCPYMYYTCNSRFKLSANIIIAFSFQTFKLFFFLSTQTTSLVNSLIMLTLWKFDQSASVAGQQTAFQSLPQDVAFSLKSAHTLIDSHGAIALWTKIPWLIPFWEAAELYQSWFVLTGKILYSQFSFSPKTVGCFVETW